MTRFEHQILYAILIREQVLIPKPLDARLDYCPCPVVLNQKCAVVQRMASLPDYRDVLDVMPDGFVIADEAGIIRLANQQLLRLFGYTAEELIGLPVEILVPEAIRAIHIEHRERYAQSPHFRPMTHDLELTGRRKDGSEFEVSVGLSPIDIGDQSMVAATISDISDRKQIETLLRRRTTHLQLLHLTNTVANDAGSAADAMAMAIEQVCKTLEFEVGHAFVTVPGASSYVVSDRDSWRLSNPQLFEEFIRESDRIAFKVGQEIPGRVMESARSIWISDAPNHPDYLRRDLAAREGLKTGIFIPVLIQEHVAAVLEFYSTREREEDPELLGVLSQIGMLLGRTLERKRSLDQYQADADFRERVLDAVGDGILIVDRIGEIEFANTWIADMFLEQRDDLIGAFIGDIPRFPMVKTFDDFPSPEHPLNQVFESGTPIFNVETRVIPPGVRPIDLSFNTTPLFDADGEVARAVLSIRDVTIQKSATELLSGQHDVLESIARGVAFSDVARRIAEHVERHIEAASVAIFVAGDNSSTLNLLAAPSLAPHIAQRVLRITPSQSEDAVARAAMSGKPALVYQTDEFHRTELVERDAVAARYGTQAIWAFPVLSSNAQLLGAIALYTAERRQPTEEERVIIERTVGLVQVAIERDSAERQLARQAFYDDLTGLPKRTLLTDRIHHAQQRAQRSGNDLALLFVDLDEFKSVNDSLGHQAGDELLRQASQRLSASVRGEDTVVRFAGDEFVVVLEEINDDSQVNLVIDRIRQAFRSPFIVEGVEVYTSCSIGVARDHGLNIAAEGLLRRADHAMYRAKAQGRGHAAVFSEETDELALSPLALESHLRVAVAAEAFELVYQPVLDLGSGTVFAFETLIRWNDEELGEVPPDTFLPVANDLGLMPQITQWVFETAARQIAAWSAEHGQDLRLMLNITPGELIGNDAIQMVRQCIREDVISPTSLILELTEQAMIETSGVAAETLRQLREYGVEIALDDFGIGYSSLSYLHQLPVSYIKLDRSFLNAPSSDQTSTAVITGIVQIAQTLGMKVIAEGVESPSNEQFARSIGCDFAQGYYFAAPRPGVDASVILNS